MHRHTHEKKMQDRFPAMRYFSRTCSHGGKMISRKDAVLLASRTLAVLLTVSALADVSYVPERLHSFLHYFNNESSSAATEYMRHYYLIGLGFLVVRIVGFALMALWLHQCGPEVEELLLPSEPELTGAPH
jgi:hypothetical protein